MDFAFTRGGCGWPADCLDDADRPALAGRLADAFDQARQIWETATPAERAEFWAWLCPEEHQP
jgi:hypothetical protein